MEIVNLAFVGGLGMTEILIIGGVAVILFGANKLPELGRGLAKGIKEFREGIREGNTPAPQKPKPTKSVRDETKK